MQQCDPRRVGALVPEGLEPFAMEMLAAGGAMGSPARTGGSRK